MTQAALIEMAEELVERQDVLATCVNCLLTKPEGCALGFTECPWAAMVLGSAYDSDDGHRAIETELTRQRRSTQLS